VTGCRFKVCSAVAASCPLARVFLGLILAACLVVGNARAESFALTHVTVIDVVGGTPQPDRTVVIVGHLIASISQSPPPDDVRVIDGRGKFLIPGLCDMHVHLAGVSADPKWS